MKRVKNYLWLVSIFLLLSNNLSIASEQSNDTLSVIRFGIVPQQSSSKLARLWSPFLAQISNKTGLRIIFSTAKDIPTFEQRLSKGEYDLAYMNPYHYTVFHESAGYQAFAKARDKKIKGILVTKVNSNTQDISQLNGSTLAFPAPAAFAASILTRAYLKNQGIEFTAKYVSSHDSVYRTVASGLYPAGGGVIRTLNNMDRNVGKKLEILWQSPGFTPHAFAAHPNLDPAKLASIKHEMIEMENSEFGLKILSRLKLKGIEAAENSDWDDVRSLDINQLFDN